ncbi:MAG: hypothetical protein H5T84_09035 [Thermoleophilia bacterium]|nr:hypothetical protein [Thermoleophilia bacterium]
MVATGHNMDDEAATLLGNLLGWHHGYLARQYPHLPALAEGVPSRIKPLVRLNKAEISAYCKLRDLNPVSTICPLAEGATTTDYKTLLNSLEEARPGIKSRFLFGFWEEEQKRFQPPSPPSLRPCAVCGMPTMAPVCLFCRSMQRAGLDPRAKLVLEKLVSSPPPQRCTEPRVAS